jgi:hypothetical protein
MRFVPLLTKINFMHPFRKMARYECDEMCALFEPPFDGSSANNYLGSDEEDHWSDPEKSRMP